MEHDSVLITHGATQVVEEPLRNLGDEAKAFWGVLRHKLEEGACDSRRNGREVDGKDVHSTIAVLIHISAYRKTNCFGETGLVVHGPSSS